MESPKRKEFLEITGVSSYQFSDLEQTQTYSCINHNAFLTMMEGAVSGKTGFTGEAGYCYVGALKREKRTFIVALLACGWPNNRSYKWEDTKKLMEYGLEHFEYQSMKGAGQKFKIRVTDGIPSLPAETKDLTALTVLLHMYTPLSDWNPESHPSPGF